MHAFKSQSVMREVLSMLNCCYFNERFHLLQRVNTQQGYIIESVKYKTNYKNHSENCNKNDYNL